MDDTEPSIIIHSPRMHEGVLGIVASRLANEYSKVSIVLKEDEYTFKGSVRSYSGVDVIYALNEISDLLLRYGGHQNAAGLEFRREVFDEFKTKFNELIPMAVRDDVITAEGEIDIYKLDPSVIYDLDRYDLKDALFVFPNLTHRSKYLIKNEHTKIIIDSETEAIFFNNKALYQKIGRDTKYHLLGRLDLNTYRGQTKKQIIIDDYQII